MCSGCWALCINTRGAGVNKTPNSASLRPTNHSCRQLWATKRDKIIGQSGGTWWVGNVVAASRVSRLLLMWQPMRSDTWLEDRKCQGLWVKWVLVRELNTESHPHLLHATKKTKQVMRIGSERVGRARAFHIFCRHLGLIKGKWWAPCSSFKDKTKCCDVIPHQPWPRRRGAL